MGNWAKLHLYLQLLSIAHITAWALPPVRSVAALHSHRSTNPTVDCTCKGSRLCASHENLILGDLRWSWGGDANAGEQLQMQIITSRRSDNTETMRNQWLAFSYESERQATVKLHLVAGCKSESDTYFSPCVACPLFYSCASFPYCALASVVVLVSPHADPSMWWVVWLFDCISQCKIVEIKCTINVMHLHHPQTIPHLDLWKNCLPWNPSLVPKRLGTIGLEEHPPYTPRLWLRCQARTHTKINQWMHN